MPPDGRPSGVRRPTAPRQRLATRSPARVPDPRGRWPISWPIATSARADRRTRRPRRPDRRRSCRISSTTLPAAGLSFVQENGGATARLIPPVTGSGGVGLIDFDGDGWLDVYLVQGGPFPPRSNAPRTGDRLFRNRRRRHVRGRRPAASGLGRPCPGATAMASPSATTTTTAAPTCSSPDGGRMPSTATGATARSRTPPTAAGLGGDRDWPTSAAFADLDDDGDLDLYVCHYLKWDADTIPPLLPTRTTDAATVCCDPARLRAAARPVFRNDGGRFVDVTAEAGIVDRDGRGLGVVAADLDDDGRDRPLRRQRHDGQLPASATSAGSASRRRAESAGVACNADGRLPGGHGGRLRRPRRRRPARPGRDQLLRRVDHLLPEPRRRPVRRPDRGRRPGRAQPLRARASASPSSTPTTTAGSTC